MIGGPKKAGLPTMAEVQSHINLADIKSKLESQIGIYNDSSVDEKTRSMTATKLTFMANNLGKFTPAFQIKFGEVLDHLSVQDIASAGTAHKELVSKHW